MQESVGETNPYHLSRSLGYTGVLSLSIKHSEIGQQTLTVYWLLSMVLN